MSWCKREKKRKNYSVIHGLGKILIYSSLIKFSPKTLTQQNYNSLELFCSHLATSCELLKWQGINHSYLKKLLQCLLLNATDLLVSAMIYRLGYSCFVEVHVSTYSTLHR